MRTTILVLLLPLLLAGCFHNSDVKPLTIEEKQLLDARHDHIRCEIKLDRLRHLYKVTEEERNGLMDMSLKAANEGGDPTNDKPLTGGHDAPLTGDHDKPLTGGHDKPLTGGHDYADALREATLESAELCWDAVSELVINYNECVVEFLSCKETSGTPENCLTEYEACLTGKRPGSEWEL